MTGPQNGKCASPLCGPGILMLGLASTDGLGVVDGGPGEKGLKLNSVLG